MLTFPFFATWDQIANLPGAADAFSWDDTMADDEYPKNLADLAESYCTCLKEPLQLYLTRIGYEVTAEGVWVRNEQALSTAHALFLQIMYEYDDEAAVRVPVVLYGHETFSTPTWALFHLSGDDDVDYNGGQPSCLSELLIQNLKAEG